MTGVVSCWIPEDEYRIGIENATKEGVKRGAINLGISLIHSKAMDIDQLHPFLLEHNVPIEEFTAALSSNQPPM